MTVTLVTGSEGFIGKHVLRVAKRGDNIAYGVDCTGNPDFVVDLTDPQDTLSVLTKINPDLIINCAGEIGEHQSWQDPIRHWRNNAFAASVLFDVARRIGVEQVLHLSTSALDHFAVETPYLITKWASEWAAYLSRQQGLNIKVIRLHNPYGPGQREDFIIPKFINLVQRGEKITVGRNARDYVYVGDVAWHLVNVAPQINEDYWDLGTGTSVTDAEVAYAVMHVLQKQVDVEFTSDNNPTVRLARNRPYKQDFLSLAEGLGMLCRSL